MREGKRREGMSAGNVVRGGCYHLACLYLSSSRKCIVSKGYRVSSIEPQTSSIEYSMSRIEYTMSSIMHHISSIEFTVPYTYTPSKMRNLAPNKALASKQHYIQIAWWERERCCVSGVGGKEALRGQRLAVQYGVRRVLRGNAFSA